MAERRMFTKKITDDDAFISMPSSAQALYFHLNQSADDDGFTRQISNAMFKAHASEDDLKVLLVKNYIIRFESGVIVIKHWRMHNTLRKDRYTPTNHQEELELLGIKKDGAYTLNGGEPLVANRLPDGCQVVTTGKDSIGKDSIDKDNNIIMSDKPTKTEKPYRIIVDYLNDKVGSKFRANNKSTQQHINARLKEGYTVDDFKTVIDKMCAKWKGTEYEEYLRPQTLFGTKFEGYLNSKGVITDDTIKRNVEEHKFFDFVPDGLNI